MVRRTSRGTADPRIPDKHAFRIGEVAALASVQPSVLRYWETEFPQLRPTKSAGGRRVYTRRDVALVLRIRDMLHDEGYTIAGARRKLRSGQGDPAPTPARTRAVLAQIREQVEQLLRLVQE